MRFMPSSAAAVYQVARRMFLMVALLEKIDSLKARSVMINRTGDDVEWSSELVSEIRQTHKLYMFLHVSVHIDK